jgi:RimJ/RimL family protein N-acetyltransferase
MSDSENVEKLGVVLTTPRLVLRAICESDLPDLHRKIFSDPDVMRYVFNGVALSYAEVVAFVREHFNSGGDKTGLSVLVERASHQIVGFAGLKSCTARARMISKSDLFWSVGLGAKDSRARSVTLSSLSDFAN